MSGATPAIRADFDRLALLSQEHWSHNDFYHGFLLRQVPTPCGEALDVGCGSGAFARLLAGRAGHVLGLDLSVEMIRVARERSAHLRNVEFRVVDVLEWAWPTESFECIASIATVHHLPLAETLARMLAALRPGGVLLVLDLCRTKAPGSLFLNAAALPASVVLRLLHTGRLCQPRAARDAWAAHGRNDSYLTLAEVRDCCRAVLPGARVRQHLLWRYSIVWHRGER